MLYAIISDIAAKNTMDSEKPSSASGAAQLKGTTTRNSGVDSSSSSDSEGSNPESAQLIPAAANDAPSGLILKGGRVRLPDKLMEYLNKEVAPEALYWMPEGESFAIDTLKAPEHILTKFFGGTKLSSFLRSISRWGFKRVFYHNLQKQVYAFHHPLFKRDAPHLEKEMKMLVSAPSQASKARKGKKVASREEFKQAPPSPATASGIVNPLGSPTTAPREPAAFFSPSVATSRESMSLLSPSAGGLTASAFAQPNLMSTQLHQSTTLPASGLSLASATADPILRAQRLLQLKRGTSRRPSFAFNQNFLGLPEMNAQPSNHPLLSAAALTGEAASSTLNTQSSNYGVASGALTGDAASSALNTLPHNQSLLASALTGETTNSPPGTLPPNQSLLAATFNANEVTTISAMNPQPPNQSLLAAALAGEAASSTTLNPQPPNQSLLAAALGGEAATSTTLNPQRPNQSLLAAALTGETATLNAQPPNQSLPAAAAFNNPTARGGGLPSTQSNELQLRMAMQLEQLRQQQQQQRQQQALQDFLEMMRRNSGPGSQR